MPSCTIITTAANDFIALIHNRMPVILPRESDKLWLDPDTDDAAVLTGILTPYPDDGMDAYEVSTLVNYAWNNGPEVILESDDWQRSCACPADPTTAAVVTHPQQALFSWA